MGADTYDLTWDAENRLTHVTKNEVLLATYVYDGDGNRVKATVNGTTTAYVGNYFQWTNGAKTSYYYLGGQRVAMRVGASAATWLLTDYLGSTAIVANASGSKVGELRYRAYGETRYTYGLVAARYRYAGQPLDTSINLYLMGARWYDAYLNRWIQPDTIIPHPENPQSLNRYSYVNNRPLGFTDSSGHYGKDVHQDLTLQLAGDVETKVTMMAGLVVSPGEAGKLRASSVAHADQYTDKNSSTTPVDFVHEGPAKDGRSIAEYYHFVSRSEAEGRLQKAIEARDVNAFGIALHAYQGYWSHTRKGFSVPIGQKGIDRIHEVCPECSSLYTHEVLEDRAKMKGHFPLKWNDEYSPKVDIDDVYMSQEMEYWIVLFFCELYGINVEDYWSLYGPTEPERASGEKEPQ